MKMPPKQQHDDTVMGNTETADLIGAGVPQYDDEPADEQEPSIRSMLAAMRTAFLQVGIRVENFENTLSRTQNQLIQLQGKIETASTEQKAYREEARAANARTNENLEGYK